MVIYKVIDTVTGEIIESIYRHVVVEEAHDRMKNYYEEYGKEFYLEYVDECTYRLIEYLVCD